MVVAPSPSSASPTAGGLPEYPGVWIDPDGARPAQDLRDRRPARREVARCTGSRSTWTTDLHYLRDHIVPCGIADKPVTSLAEEGVDVSMAQVVDIVARHAADVWGGGAIERQDVAWKHRPDDLSPFSRGEGAGAAVRTAADHGRRWRAASRRGMLRPGCEQAGVSDGLRSPHASPSGCGPRWCTAPRCWR